MAGDGSAGRQAWHPLHLPNPALLQSKSLRPLGSTLSYTRVKGKKATTSGVELGAKTAHSAGEIENPLAPRIQVKSTVAEGGLNRKTPENPNSARLTQPPTLMP